MSEQSRKKRRRARLTSLIVAAVIIVAAGLTYFLLSHDSPEESETTEPEMQMATVRQGDISLGATGAGTLVAGDEVTTGFEAEGTLKEVYVDKGDSVEAGDLIATLDSSEAEETLADAEQNLAEMTSTLAIAELKVEIAALEETLSKSRNHLAYLISPSVLYYEEKLAEAQEAFGAATEAEDEEAIAEAEQAITRAEANLTYYWNVYREEYVPDAFTVEERDEDNPRKTVEVVYAPTDYAINNARTEYNYYVESLKAENDYLEALETGVIPEGAMGQDIVDLRAAMKAIETAQENVDKCQLYAPISGVVTELTAKVGEKPDSNFVTLLDLDHPYLEIYLDASDWDMVDIDYDVEIVFDAYPDLTLTGKVTYVDPFITNNGMATLIYGQVTLDKESLEKISDLPIGSEATVDVIMGGAENAVLVPVEALNKTGDQYSVFVVVDGELEIRFVEVGLMETYYAEVLSGLEVGEVVSTGIVETN